MFQTAVPRGTPEEQIIQSIRDFGPVLGLHLGEGELCGSLSRIETALELGSRSNHRGVASRAQAALDAVQARERVNGSEWERSHTKEFELLTVAARDAVSELYQYVTRRRN